EGVIIDTPPEPEVILEEASTTRVKAFLMTLCHQDHIEGHRDIKLATEALVAVHPAGAAKLPMKPDIMLKHGQTFSFGKLKLSVIHTPGHTPEGLCFLWGRHLFSGDSLFPHGPGKTGSPADFQQLLRSIQERLLPLPDDTRVYPGHGNNTVLGSEKEEVGVFLSKPHRPDLCGDVLWLES
ncbi:MAG: MBL fold metallo-hydrolase, partial [Chloroflexi bacterium]|nr:MBL fold metallo-hydrolase [Chloroflexota bacterium]